jgi:ArsR family transcriptional regulator
MIGSTVVDAFDADAAVPLMKALADPTRLRIVALLGAGPRCVCSLQEEVDVAANLLSHHLKVLREAGLIAGTRRGRWIDYRLRAEAFDDTLRLLAALRNGAPVTSCTSAVRSAAAPAGVR